MPAMIPYAHAHETVRAGGAVRRGDTDDACHVPLLSTTGLTCHRGDRLLFADLSLALEPGEVLQVHGPNGGGKTTLLRTLCGLTLPTAGRIFWRDREVLHGQRIETYRFRSSVCYVGHANGVKSELTPRENLRVWRATSASPAAIDVDRALDAVGLFGLEDVPAVALSAGQRRRVALARLLIGRTDLWILDEPFTSLDRDGVSWVEQRLAEHVAAGGAVIVTSHQPIQLPLATRSLELEPPP